MQSTEHRNAVYWATLWRIKNLSAEHQMPASKAPAGLEIQAAHQILPIRHSVEQKDLSFVHCRAGKALTTSIAQSSRGPLAGQLRAIPCSSEILWLRVA